MTDTRERNKRHKGALPPLTPTRSVTSLDPPRVMGSKGSPLGGSRAEPWSGARGRSPHGSITKLTGTKLTGTSLTGMSPP
jgi:hypothetical protein